MEGNDLKNREKALIDDYGGILPYTEIFYIASIIYSAEAAIISFSRFQLACCRTDDDSAVASAIHETLGHAASLSRFFWPASSKALPQARARRLRTIFAVDESSPLKARQLRNALEHFDERLDSFLLGDCVGHVFPDAMVASAEITDEPTAKIFKLVDPDKGIFVVLNEKFFFNPVVEEVGRILNLAYELYNEPQ